MQVKCQICGKKIDRETAYKVEINGLNKYFCSQEEYEAERERKAKKKRNLEVIAECYQYCVDYIEPPYNIIRKELKEGWLAGIDEDVICAFIEESREKLKDVTERKITRDGQFDSIYGACRYVGSIIRREIIDRKWKSKRTPTALTIRPSNDITVYKERQKEIPITRRPLIELLEGITDADN